MGDLGGRVFHFESDERAEVYLQMHPPDLMDLSV